MISLKKLSTLETIVLLSQHRDKSTCFDERGSRQIEMQASRLASLLAQKPDDTIESDLDELDTTRAELKARDQRECVRLVNGIRNMAEEIVLKELVF